MVPQYFGLALGQVLPILWQVTSEWLEKTPFQYEFHQEGVRGRPEEFRKAPAQYLCAATGSPGPFSVTPLR